MSLAERQAYAIALQMKDDPRNHFKNFLQHGTLTTVGYALLKNRDILTVDEYGSPILTDIGRAVRDILEREEP